MAETRTNGNNPERWEKLLNLLDERLQLGLLDRLKKVSTYHFEEDLLIIEPASKEEYEYFAREGIRQQVELFAREACRIDVVKIKKPGA